MGINMRVALVYGVKLEGETDIAFRDGELDCLSTPKLINSFGYLNDCYSDEWVFFGTLLKITDDFRHEGWADFFWDCNVNEDIKLNTEQHLISNNILETPKIYCLTYYS